MSEWIEWLCQCEQQHGQKYVIGGTGGELLGVYRTSDMTLVGEFGNEELLHLFRGLAIYGKVVRECPIGFSEIKQTTDNAVKAGMLEPCMTDIERVCYLLDVINSGEGE